MPQLKVAQRDHAERARRLASQRAGGQQVWPEENYYGWLINDRLAELQKLL